MKLLNWQFQYWHFNKYFILCTGTGVLNLLVLKDFAYKRKTFPMKVQLFIVRVD